MSKTMTAEVESHESLPQQQTQDTFQQGGESLAEEDRSRTKEVLENRDFTSEKLNNRMEELLAKPDLTVENLESISADLATYLTYSPKEDLNGLADKVENLYRKLLALSAKVQLTPENANRLTASVQMVKGLEWKVKYFNQHMANPNGNVYKSFPASSL